MKTAMAVSADFTLFLLTVLSLALTIMADPELEIFPNQNPLLARAGNSLGLMCRGKSETDGDFTSMKWFDPNGEEIPESSPKLKRQGSNLKLTFNDPKVADSGIYRCTALFSNTVTLEKQIKIMFYEPIRFDDCPNVQNLVVGLEGRVQCRVVGYPSPSINWEKNDRIVQSDRVSIDESGIIISSVSLEDAGVYFVEAFVKETGGNEIQEIEVNVLVPPKIIELPETFVVIQGVVDTITCRATGSPPLTYSWYDPSRRDLSKVEGFSVEEGSLTITDVDRNAGGEYTCEVMNPASKDHATVRIEVQVKPKIVQMQNTTREEGKDALFECRGEGVPKPKMSIRRDNSNENIVDNLDDGIELEVMDEGPQKVLRLRITNVKRSDDGLYYCKAANAAGSTEQVGHLEVQFRPDMSRTQPIEVKTWSNNPANLSCIAEANPNATIAWKFQGMPIEAGDERFKIFGAVSHSNLLVLTANRPHYEVFGKYTCEARNTLGENAIDITLDEATVPSQVTQIVFDKVTSTTITFRLMGPGNTGGMPITYYIMRYKLADQPDSTMNVVEWLKDTPYILNNLIPRAKYRFSAAARNLVGDGPWKTEDYIMPVETVPEPPLIKTAMNAVSQYPDTFEVRWDVPNNNGKPILKYGVRYFKVDHGLKDWIQMDKAVERSVAADTQSFQLTGLLPDTYYKIEIRATNAIGNSQPESVVIRTSKGEMNNGHTHLNPNEIDIPIPLIVGVVIGILLVTLIVLDVTCFFRYHCGLLYLMRYRTCSRLPEKVPVNMEEGKVWIPRPADLIIDENFKNKSPKGSKTSIGKSSPV